MATNGTVGYNLVHTQAALLGDEDWVDIPYSITMDPQIDQQSAPLKADGKTATIAYGSPEGGGTLSFGAITGTTVALLTGGVASTSGTGATLIDRVEVKGDGTPPSLALSSWIPNTDGNLLSAGLRLTLPNAKCSVPSGAYDQETFANQSANLTFSADTNNTMLVYEFLAEAPEMTDGVMPVNLIAPNP
jgi:hypothetical protein